jgi:hypothetical protein
MQSHGDSPYTKPRDLDGRKGHGSFAPGTGKCLGLTPAKGEGDAVPPRYGASPLVSAVVVARQFELGHYWTAVPVRLEMACWWPSRRQRDDCPVLMVPAAWLLLHLDPALLFAPASGDVEIRQVEVEARQCDRTSARTVSRFGVAQSEQPHREPHGPPSLLTLNNATYWFSGSSSV